VRNYITCGFLPAKIVFEQGRIAGLLAAARTSAAEACVFFGAFAARLNAVPFPVVVFGWQVAALDGEGAGAEALLNS
jgi:hypothetical protein